MLSLPALVIVEPDLLLELRLLSFVFELALPVDLFKLGTLAITPDTAEATVGPVTTLALSSPPPDPLLMISSMGSAADWAADGITDALVPIEPAEV